MNSYCSKCHGLGEVPTGGQTMTSAVNMSWGTCPDCDGTGVSYDCAECCDSGVNVYDANFNPANPQPCQHCQPATQAA